MLDTATLPNPAPKLAALPVGELVTHFATALPWLTDCYGLVQTGLDKAGKQRYPRIYRNDGTRTSTDIRPDDKMGALCFFELDGPSLFEPDEGSAGTWLHQLAATVWVNLPRLAPALQYDFSEELAQDFFTRGLLDSPFGFDLVPERIELQTERVFERYRWDESVHQLLMHPYAGFRIPFTVRTPFSRCAPPLLPISQDPVITDPVFTSI